MSGYRRTSRQQLTRSDTPSHSEGVLYLRVSSVRQTHTAVDIDADGNSIATQREECQALAGRMGVPVVREFVEPGKSAQTIEKRPAFRQLLAYLAENPEIDYVFVYARSRAFRNVEEAILTRKHLRGLGVKIVSTKENFGDTMEADFMEVITDSMNDLQNKRSGEDIKMKMAHKARNGGTVSRAPIGYLNTRVDVEGRLINSIALDEQRAPLVRLCFELYATGDYTIEQLAEAAEDHGLRARPAGRWKASRPITKNSLRRILADPYYAGYVYYDGELYDGRHPAIVDQALFDRVQDVLDTRSTVESRQRVLRHYLKGSLRCDRCHQAGRIRRLIYTEAKNRHGNRYGYFLCRGRQLKECDLPHLPVQQVEEAIVGHYRTLQLDAAYHQQFQAALESALADQQATTRELDRNLRREHAKLSEQEDRLIDALADGTLSSSKLQQRIADLRRRQHLIEGRFQQTGQELATGATVLRSVLDACRDPQQLYASATDDARGLLNKSFFHALYLSDHGVVADTHLSELFAPIQASQREWRRLNGSSGHEAFSSREGVDQAEDGTSSGEQATSQAHQRKQRSVLDEALRVILDHSAEPGLELVKGSSTAIMVELRGLEPLTPSMPWRCATSCATAPHPSQPGGLRNHRARVAGDANPLRYPRFRGPGSLLTGGDVGRAAGERRRAARPATPAGSRSPHAGWPTGIPGPGHSRRRATSRPAPGSRCLRRR